MPYPDIEALLVAYLADRTGERVVTDLPANLDDILPVIRVSRSGGADSDYKLDRSSVDVDVFAGNRVDAAALAGEVRDVLRIDLPNSVTPSGVVTGVVTSIAPTWLPDPNVTLRRFHASYEVYAHS